MKMPLKISLCLSLFIAAAGGAFAGETISTDDEAIARLAKAKTIVEKIENENACTEREFYDIRETVSSLSRYSSNTLPAQFNNDARKVYSQYHAIERDFQDAGNGLRKRDWLKTAENKDTFHEPRSALLRKAIGHFNPEDERKLQETAEREHRQSEAKKQERESDEIKKNIQSIKDALDGNDSFNIRISVNFDKNTSEELKQEYALLQKRIFLRMAGLPETNQLRDGENFNTMARRILNDCFTAGKWDDARRTINALIEISGQSGRQTVSGISGTASGNWRHQMAHNCQLTRSPYTNSMPRVVISPPYQISSQTPEETHTIACYILLCGVDYGLINTNYIKQNLESLKKDRPGDYRRGRENFKNLFFKNPDAFAYSHFGLIDNPLIFTYCSKEDRRASSAGNFVIPAKLEDEQTSKTN